MEYDEPTCGIDGLAPSGLAVMEGLFRPRPLAWAGIGRPFGGSQMYKLKSRAKAWLKPAKAMP